jgi:hypothetical protein
MSAPPNALRLLAEDAEDIQIISAALQDAVAQVGDILYEPAERRLTIVFNRFLWERQGRVGDGRVRSALQLGSVMSVKARRLKRDPKDAVVELLALDFQPGDTPAGSVMLSFAGGADLVAEVECLDAVLADISQPWPTRRSPRHELG